MEEQSKCPKCNAVLEDGAERCIHCEESSIIVKEKENNFLDRLPFKKVFLVYGIAAIILIIIVVLFLSKGSMASETVTYVKDGELHVLGMKNEKPVQLSEDLRKAEDSIMEQHVLKSADNRYVFYPDSMNEYDDATYYWRDLTKDNSKADSAKRVDTEVHDNNFLTPDGNKFFYIKGSENRLYVFDRKSGEKSKLDDDVNEFYVSENGDYIVYSTYENEESTLYEMTVKDLSGTKTKIDANSYIYYADMDNKTILYDKDGTLYTKSYKKDKVKVVSDYEYLPQVYSTHSFYYVKSEEMTSKLIDLIEDDLASTDTEVSEPEYPEFPNSPDYPDESDYSTMVWVDSVYGDEQNPETHEWGYWDTTLDEEAYNKAYEEYEKKYEEWDKEYTSLEEAYYSAVDLYDAKLEREYLREELENEENAITYYTYSLYYFNEGKETLVASNILAGIPFVSSDMPLVVYNKVSTSENSKQKLSTLIDEIGWYDVEDFIYELTDRTDTLQVASSELFVTYGSGKEQVIDVESDDIYSYRVDNKGNLYLLVDYDYDKEVGVLKKVPIKDGVISKVVVIDEDVAELSYGLKNNTLMYYFKNTKDGSGDMYLDGKLVTEDMFMNSLYTYDDGQLIYYKEFSNKKYRGTLTLYKNGKETKISDDAAMYVPIDENHIVFLHDYNYDRSKGDLMLYEGNSKPKLVDTDVSYILNSYY